MLKLYKELKRRKVLTTLGVYGAAALVIINLATSVFPYLMLPPWTVRFVIVLIFLGFPITFFLSWTYDLKREAGQDKKSEYSDEESVKKSRTVLLPITGLLTIIGSAFWFWYGLGNISTASEVDFQMGIKKTVAILGFDNHTGNKNGDYFCSAITEQVRASLSKLSRLDVKSRLSSEQIKGGNIGVGGDVFSGLDYYVEGALSQIADNRKINISLINAKNQNTKWSRQYTFAENEILQYQDTILNNIAQNLDIDFDPMILLDQKSIYKNSTSFQLIGEGIYHFDNANYKGALASFNSVLDLDPNNINAQFHKANTLAKLERFDAAVNIYSDLLKESKSSDYINWVWELPQYKNIKPSLFSASRCFSCYDDILISVLNQEQVILLLNGNDESRLIRLNVETRDIIWSQPVPDGKVENPIIINNLILLISNHLKGAESAIFAYDLNTGMQQFIHEFPRNENRFITVEIFQDYNKTSEDSLSILVYKKVFHEKLLRREMVLLDNKGIEVWNAFIGKGQLHDLAINVVNKGSENFIVFINGRYIYKINAETGVVVWHKSFLMGYGVLRWDDYLLALPFENESGIISLWDPIKEQEVWSYTLPSKIYGFDRFPHPNHAMYNDDLVPLAVCSLENGDLTVFDLNMGWFRWNPVSWSHNIGSAGNVKIGARVFCLTDNSLLTFNRVSGKKINEIELDHTNHKNLTDQTLNPQILYNKKFIMAIDPLNGDQLWKIKELNKYNNLKIKLFEKNLLVANPIENDSIIILNNYHRDDGNLIWSKIFDFGAHMQKYLSKRALEKQDYNFESLFDKGMRFILANFNDQAYMVLDDAIIEINLVSEKRVTHIEPKDVRLGLARAFASLNKANQAEIQYRSVIEKHDQMSREAHWELANLYSGRNNNNAAVTSLLRYYDLILPDSKEAGQTLQKLKEITPLRWSQNIFSTSNDFLLVDENKIFRINIFGIEIYRLSSGALLNKISLDKNTASVLGVSLKDKDNLYLITTVENANVFAKEDTVTIGSTAKYNTMNLLSINKNTGELLYSQILNFFHRSIQGFTIDNKYIYVESVDDKSLWLRAYDKKDGVEQWKREFDRPEYYALRDLSSVFYNEKIIIPLNDDIIYLNRDDGRVLGEYVFDDIEQITTFNQHGLYGNILTFFSEDFDNELLTFNLETEKLINRQIIEYEKPSLDLNYKNRFFDIDHFGRLSAYSFSGGDNKVMFDWENNYNKLISLVGQTNGLLYLFDNADNSIFSVQPSSGDVVKTKLPLLWSAKELGIYNDFIIVQSDGRLYVMKNI